MASEASASTLRVSIDMPTAFRSAAIADLTGTASADVTSIQLFDNGTSLGTTSDHPTFWAFDDVALVPGLNTFSAIATDADGNASPLTEATFTVETGITGQPWSTYEAGYDKAGDLNREIYVEQSGLIYAQDDVRTLANGDHEVSTLGGYFPHRGELEYVETDLYSADYGVLKQQTFFGFTSTEIDGAVSGLTIHSRLNDTITGGGHHETFVFKPYWGSDTIKDFKVGGAGHDVLSLPSADLSSVAQVLQNTYMTHGHAVINVDDANEIILQHVTKAELRANRADFKFHG